MSIPNSSNPHIAEEKDTSSSNPHNAEEKETKKVSLSSTSDDDGVKGVNDASTDHSLLSRHLIKVKENRLVEGISTKKTESDEVHKLDVSCKECPYCVVGSPKLAELSTMSYEEDRRYWLHLDGICTGKAMLKEGMAPKRQGLLCMNSCEEGIRNRKASLSESDWGTGDASRRSGGIKSKATQSPEIEPPKKRERTSSSKGATFRDAEDAKMDIDVEGKDRQGKDSTAERAAAKTKEQNSEDKSEKNVEKVEDPGAASTKIDSEVEGGPMEKDSEENLEQGSVDEKLHHFWGLPPD